MSYYGQRWGGSPDNADDVERLELLASEIDGLADWELRSTFRTDVLALAPVGGGAPIALRLLH